MTCHFSGYVTSISDKRKSFEGSDVESTKTKKKQKQKHFLYGQAKRYEGHF